MNYAKPLPIITATNAPYWEALRQHEVKLQKCLNCHSWIWPIAPYCQKCWEGEYEWTKISGRGTISAWVRYHKAFDPVYVDDLPYNVIQVDLPEGVRLISNLVNEGSEDVRAGLLVEPVFEVVTSAVTLLKYQIAEA
jgi:uncharacterized protein